MHHSSLLAWTVLATSGVAQSVVLPSAVTAAPPVSAVSDYTTFQAPESRTQLAYDVNDVGPAATTWNSLQMRAPAAALGVFPLTFTTTATVVLSLSPLAPTSMTSSFAGNVAGAASTATVFTGTLSLPARLGAAWPQPWEAPIPFTAPYLFLKPIGKSLVLEIAQGPAPMTTLIRELEASGVDKGSLLVAGLPGVACKLTNGAMVTGRPAYPTPYPGGSWWFGYAILPASGSLPALAFGVLGALGPGSSWNGLPLPADLTPFGAPGCPLSASLDVVVPLTVSGNIAKSGTFLVPNLPSLGGQSFYEQGIFVDPTANTLGIVTSWTTRWSVGTLKGAPGVTVWATGNGAKTATSGSLLVGMLTTIRLN